MSEEPQFFRIRAPENYHCPWVADVKFGVSITLSVEKSSARIFMSPSKEQLDYIKFLLGGFILDPATFGDWIDQDPNREPSR